VIPNIRTKYNPAHRHKDVVVQGIQTSEIRAKCRKTNGTTMIQLGRNGRTHPGFPTVTNAALVCPRPVVVLLMATSLETRMIQKIRQSSLIS